jgi:hypothetical protein
VCRGAKAAHADADYDQRDRAETQEQYSLESVDPGRAAHAAEEHVAHHYECDNRATEPERNEPVADRVERGATAHNANDDVRHQQDCLDHEDHRADVTAFPAISKHLHGRHEAMFLTERPNTCADQKDRQWND